MSGVTFNLFDRTKLGSQEYCKAWYFKCQQDSSTVGKLIQQDEYDQLLSQYSSKLEQWDADYEKDKFEWSEEDWDNFYKTTMKDDYDNGTKTAKETKVTLDEDKNTSSTVGEIDEKNDKTNKWQPAVTLAAEGLGAAGTIVGATVVSQTATQSALVSLGPTATYSQATAKAHAKASSIIACVTALAIGILYECTRPNVDEGKALETLKTLFESTESDNLKSAQAELNNTGGECVTASEDAFAVQEDKAGIFADAQSEYEKKQEELAEKQEQYELSVRVMKTIQARVDAGEQLSSEDQAKFEAAKAQVAALGEEVQTLNDEVTELQDNVLVANDEFLEAQDNATETIDNTQGTFNEKMDDAARIKGEMDYAASIDEKTKGNAITQLVSQSANIALGLYGGIRATIEACTAFTFWKALFAVMGFAGAGMSTHAVVEQSKVIKQANEEIAAREALEANVVETQDVYETNITLKNIANDDVNSFVIDDIDSVSDWEVDTSWYSEDSANTELNYTPQADDTDDELVIEPKISGSGNVNNFFIGQENNEDDEVIEKPGKKN